MSKCFTLTLLQDPTLTGDLLLFAIGLGELQETTEYLTTKKWEPALLKCLGWDHHRLRGAIRRGGTLHQYQMSCRKRVILCPGTS
ncbi:hypothetical protein [Arthrobacter woluwensis]|uniref:hypothetical protein n=1 Tax=Arthrobacter woluwensis TaxID=156980 RepID=UPI003827DE2E